jgi:hypothetical protein
MNTEEKFDAWAIVELMGHRKMAGRVSEQVIAGAALLRIDVPDVTAADGQALKGFTQFYGASSIYCLTPSTEEICKRFTIYHRERPVQSYELPQLAAAAPDLESARTNGSRERACISCGLLPEDGHAESCEFFDDDDADDEPEPIPASGDPDPEGDGEFR